MPAPRGYLNHCPNPLPYSEQAKEEVDMSDHRTYKKLELVGSSPTSIEDAINNAIAECSKSVKNIEWFEVMETRGHIVDGKVGHYQVVLKIGFRIESS
jgi:flavin-binding protein dodecin